MVYSTFVMTSGVYTDEQDLASKLDTFMITTISGWNQIEIITNTATDRDTAYYGIGSTPGEYDRSYVRVRGTGDELRFSVASNYNASTNTFSDLVTSADTELPAGTTSGNYWFIGNADSVYVTIMHPGPGFSKHFGGFGTWLTYYDKEYDPKPHYAFGHQTSSETFESDRCKSYSPGSWGKSAEKSPSTSSGTSQIYLAEHSADIEEASPQVRTNQPYLFEAVFYHATNLDTSEVRGEMPGLYMIGGQPYTHGNVVTISGIGTISGKYFIHKQSNSACWAIGKIFP